MIKSDSKGLDSNNCVIHPEEEIIAGKPGKLWSQSLLSQPWIKKYLYFTKLIQDWFVFLEEHKLSGDHN